jgi:SPP1 gp7 family putative phage head morphogenesis protein
MPDIDLKYALDLPPEKTIEYFESKGQKITWDWHEMLNEAHAKAFTVAKVARADILQDIKNEIDSALKDGTGYEVFKKNLIPKLKAKGWWGKQIVVDSAGVAKEVQLGSPRRLQLIYDTNMQVAFQQGKYKTQKAAASLAPYWQYITQDDSRVRPSHAALHGKVFRHDDPFWDNFYPPNGYRCRCRVKAIDEKQLKKQNITPESAKGKLINTERHIGDKTILNTQYRVHGKNGYINVSPDPGWNYNPGKSPLKPDLNKYDENIFDELKKAYAKEKKPVPYASAKEIKTAENFARKHIARKVDYSDFELNIANQINDHLNLRLQELNYMPKKLESIGTSEKVSYMGINNLHLRLNPNQTTKKAWENFWENFSTGEIPPSAIGHLEKSFCLKASLDHEIGHIVFEKTIKDRKKLTKWSQTLTVALSQGWEYPSIYASKGNVKDKNLILSQQKEAFCECMMLYLNNRKDKLSDNIIQYFDNLQIRRPLR